jgi:hypothetical protein
VPISELLIPVDQNFLETARRGEKAASPAEVPEGCRTISE